MNLEPLEDYDTKVRLIWNEELNEWHYSILDVIELLTGTSRPC